MYEIVPWLIIVGSFLLIGVFGYAAIGRNAKRPAIAGVRIFVMVAGAIVSAFVLISFACRIFMKIEIETVYKLGSIHEDQMQPDMPNLMAGLIMFGWVFFLAGLTVALLSKRTSN